MLDNIPDMSQYETNESVMLSQLDIFQQQQMQSIGTTTSLAPPPPSQVNIMTGVYTLQEEPEETDENAMWISTKHLMLINSAIRIEGEIQILISLFANWTSFARSTKMFIQITPGGFSKRVELWVACMLATAGNFCLERAVIHETSHIQAV